MHFRLQYLLFLADSLCHLPFYPASPVILFLFFSDCSSSADSFLALPGPSAHCHLNMWNPSVPPHHFLTVRAEHLLRVAFMGGLNLLQVQNA